MRRFSFIAIIPLAAVLIALWTAPCEPATFADEPKGFVEESDGGLFVTRDTRRMPLDVESDVYEYDILETDSNGSAVIHFLDDSILEMGSDTRIDVKELIFTSARKKFNVGLAHGAARIITGAIVKFNPKVFKLTTPKSSIGIRGTTLHVEVTEQFERVTVENLSEGSSVTCTNTESGGSYTMTEVQDSVTISSVEQVDPVTGVVSTSTETTAQGIGVVEGIQDPGGGIGGGGSQQSGPSQGIGEGGNDSAGSHGDHSSGDSGSSGGGCGDSNSSPGR